jgi:hypothetical protein
MNPELLNQKKIYLDAKKSDKYKLPIPGSISLFSTNTNEKKN